MNSLAIWSICCKTAYRWFGAKAVIVKPIAGEQERSGEQGRSEEHGKTSLTWH